MMADALLVVAAQGTGFSKFLHHRASNATLISLTDFSSDASSSSSSTTTGGSLHISALLQPLGAVAPPPVRPSSLRPVRRSLLKRRRRTRRRSSDGNEDDGSVDRDGGGRDDDPSFGGAGGGGSSSNGFRWSNWDDSSSYPSDPAFDFVYEVLCWIVLSNCVHFAFKKVVRLLAEGFADQEREKAPLRLASVC
ncbi:hypothetical protein Dimus_029417 [Dionaea muscipula]